MIFYTPILSKALILNEPHGGDMKTVRNVVGVVLILMGGFWILQGINVIPIGFMAGRVEYAYLGAAIAIVGLGLLVLGNRRRKGTPPAPK